MNEILTDCYTQALIGASLQDVELLLGKPFASHYTNGMFVQIHHIGDNYTSIFFTDGRVSKIDHQNERRTVPRVKPITKRPAYIRYGNHRIRATVTSISIKSGVFEMPAEDQTPLPRLATGDFVTTCLSFKLRQNTCSFVSLAGHILETKNNKATILWNTPFETHSSRVLREYISAHLALESLGKATHIEQHSLLDGPDDKIAIIKSDLCVYCTEGACGLHYNPHHEKVLPTHGGLR
ncbi:hypothetical protein FY034_17275 (plasmid) [Trichlorobacter lovleyi]|uniref:hypothetical protein n=1 Tax=Trichlorobacter lovleyi TaxID=313985 RepID=UPI00223F4E33|nr:hypothetical protein [Trichlorobacter lovleyi]QOX80775.1 hypothetical protein FY034_17275 [Trichlorobacter lovleyi]